MSWVYLLMKKVVATETMRKLEMIGSGKELASWVGEDIPEPYGGKAQALGTGENDTAISPRDVDAETAAAAAVEAAKKEEEAKVEEAKKAEEAKEEAAKAAPATEETVAVVESVKEVAVSPETATPAETPAVATPAEGVVEGPKTIEPLQLTEPVTTAPVVVAVVEKE